MTVAKQVCSIVHIVTIVCIDIAIVTETVTGFGNQQVSVTYEQLEQHTEYLQSSRYGDIFKDIRFTEYVYHWFKYLVADINVLLTSTCVIYLQDSSL